MKVNLANIKLFQDDKAIKSMAFALLIKDAYVSSSVKNYNPYSLQQKLSAKGFKFHHTTITKYVDNLIKSDLAEIKDNCLIIKKLHTDKTDKIHIKKGYAKEFKDYVHLIRGEQFKRKYWQAEYVYEKRSLSTKVIRDPKTLKEYKVAKRLEKKYGLLGSDETTFNYKQSILSFCAEFNCSVGEFYSTLKYLIRKRWIKVKNHFTKVCKYFGGVIESSKYFVKDDWLFFVECNTYKVMPNQRRKKKNKITCIDSKK